MFPNQDMDSKTRPCYCFVKGCGNVAGGFNDVSLSTYYRHRDLDIAALKDQGTY
jgi:hypothetical protein